jgi:hypothetical protein
MVGVVGSSPIAPTKQNPLCWAVWKGSPKGGPFFVGWRFTPHLHKTPGSLTLKVKTGMFDGFSDLPYSQCLRFLVTSMLPRF